ncbi:dihydrofolate reductase family protein [Frigoribacterium sp. CFBP 8759]|uniref:dihydrofolate reductase family protein n=1 Tax=Frigoribacterium sp. CFBP 8759 TaxID=2775283 RepID=UPI00177AAA03|nr:dihydrofolate reductase family protein [Frigoribacterium sp. CFBP 8759]
MTLRVLHALGRPGDVGLELEIDEDSTPARIRELYAPPSETWLRLNLIAAVSGDAAGADGTSETLSNATDRTILAAIRSLADGVLVGAASVRAEGYRVPKSSRLVVVTASGDLSGHRMDPAEAERVVVVCPESARARVRETLGEAIWASARVLTATDDGGRLEPAAILRCLREQRLRSLVCEGGPSLAGQFLRDGLVDELCLSTSPVVIGSGLPVFGRERFDPASLVLGQLLVDEQSTLYARWSVDGGPASR